MSGIKEETYSKVSTCFAAHVYRMYLQKRYGVNACKDIDFDYIAQLERLKDLFYFKTYPMEMDGLDKINTYKNKCTDGCSIPAIIEKINTL